MKLRSKYTLECPFGHWRHSFEIIGQRGALSLHVSDSGAGVHFERFNGGLEMHWRECPEHRYGDAPDHDRCSSLQAPCWHDGTSLYVSDVIVPQFAPFDDPRAVLSFLEQEYHNRFHA